MKSYGLIQYGGVYRQVCHGIKEGDVECCRIASYTMSQWIPANATVVPMPGHLGWADGMLKVANFMKAIRSDIKVADCLKCFPHESNYDVKKRGEVPKKIEFYLTEKVDGIPLVVIDNVVETGCTIAGALSVLPNYAFGLALCRANRKEK